MKGRPCWHVCHFGNNYSNLIGIWNRTTVSLLSRCPYFQASAVCFLLNSSVMFVWVDAVIWWSDLYNCACFGAPGWFFLLPASDAFSGGWCVPIAMVFRRVPGMLAVHLGPVMQIRPSGRQEKSQITSSLPSQRCPTIFLSHWTR